MQETLDKKETEYRKGCPADPPADLIYCIEVPYDMIIKCGNMIAVGAHEDMKKMIYEHAYACYDLQGTSA